MRPKLSSVEKYNRNMRWRMIGLMLIFGLGIFVPLFIQLYDIQINRHDELEQKAIAQQMDRGKVTANRGTIYDRNMNVIASSGSAETLIIDPFNIESDEQARLIARGISDILGLEYDSMLEKTAQREVRYIVIAIKLEKELAEEIRLFIQANKLTRQMKLEADSKRYYTYSNMAAQVLGFVGRDNSGLDGLEAKYNTLLTGTPGHTISVSDREGRILPNQYEMFYEAEDGKSLVLTLDETIQHFLEKHLETALIENQVAEKATGIVMDVKTGAILGMATKGDFDPNNYQEITDPAVLEYLSQFEGEEYAAQLKAAREAMWRNKAISDTYEPGSTFKIISAAIALETASVNLQSETFHCSGSMKNIGGWDINCHKRSGHGTQTLAEAIQNSCNPAFIQIAQKIGPENFYNFMRSFGFFERTGIDMTGEASNQGLYHTWEAYSSQAATQATYSFGQTFKISPIQLITAVSAVANGGYLMQPYVVGDSIDQNGVRTAVNTPTVVRQVISEETSAIMRGLLEDAVALGTGKNASVLGYRIAGKTGTSQKRDKYDDEGNYIGDGCYVVSFVGFAPADDPQVAVLVVLDEPGRERNLRSGGYMAAPVGGRIFADVLPYLGIAPHYSEAELSMADLRVPSLVGKSLEDAKTALKSSGVQYKIIGTGSEITGQIPSAGIRVPGTAEILVYAGADVPTELVEVPAVLGRSPEKVNKAMADVGLFMKATGAAGLGANDIVAAFQTIEPGTMVPIGTIIEVEFRSSSVTDSIG